jgi:hypothetical protein
MMTVDSEETKAELNQLTYVHTTHLAIIASRPATGDTTLEVERVPEETV